MLCHFSLIFILAIHEFPEDIFTNRERTRGAVLLHILGVCMSTPDSPFDPFILNKRRISDNFLMIINSLSAPWHAVWLDSLFNWKHHECTGPSASTVINCKLNKKHKQAVTDSRCPWAQYINNRQKVCCIRFQTGAVEKLAQRDMK